MKYLNPLAICQLSRAEREDIEAELGEVLICECYECRRGRWEDFKYDQERDQ